MITSSLFIQSKKLVDTCALNNISWKSLDDYNYLIQQAFFVLKLYLLNEDADNLCEIDYVNIKSSLYIISTLKIHKEKIKSVEECIIKIKENPNCTNKILLERINNYIDNPKFINIKV